MIVPVIVCESILPKCQTNRELIEYLANPPGQQALFCGPGAGISPQAPGVASGGEHGPVPRIAREFWTSRQRKASSIHEISYRACFKPQLPRFFIRMLTQEGDVVYDPFSGRGTTVIEAALLSRRCVANDVNPLSQVLTLPRLALPDPEEVRHRLTHIPFTLGLEADLDILMFFHHKTEAEIVSLKNYLHNRIADGRYDHLDAWIRMVATNRLTGHSTGFFSVYTLPPNQAVSGESQKKINKKRNQSPAYRDTRAIIWKKTVSLFRTLTKEDRQALSLAGRSALFLCSDARSTPEIADGSIQLTVTSPPFLDIVQYAKDNWLRCWFNGIEDDAVSRQITMARTPGDWAEVMGGVFQELYRVTAPGGFVAFEVGEVRKGSVKLEDTVLPLGAGAGFEPVCVLINQQQFTKTAHLWGVGNNTGGTNTNRIVLFRKAA